MDYVLKAIQQLLLAGVAAGSSPIANVKEVIIGAHKQIPQDSLPAILVYANNVEYLGVNTAKERLKATVSVVLIFNARSFYEKDTIQSTDNIVYSFLDMLQMVQGATSVSNQTPTTNTIIQILTNNTLLPYSGTPTCSAVS